MEVLRSIVGQFLKPNGSPFDEQVVIFKLLKGSYTIAAQFPRYGIPIITDEDGKFSVDLWASATGYIATHYQCIDPAGDSFEFSVPSGVGELELSVLRGASTPLPPSTQNVIFAYVDQAIDAHNADINAHPGLAGGGDSAQFEAEAASNFLIGSPAHLRSDGFLVLAQASLPGLSRVDGIAVVDAAVGSSAIVKPLTVVERSNWTPIAGSTQLTRGVYYLDAASPGRITPVPPQAGYQVLVGKAISPTKFLSDPQIPIRL